MGKDRPGLANAHGAGQARPGLVNVHWAEQV